MAELLFKDPKEYIHLEFELRKNRRPAYSMRAFARDLKVSPSSLNDFIKGRVGMSEARIEDMSQFLNWPEERKNHFKDLVFSKFDKDPAVRQTASMRVKRRLQEKLSYFDLNDFQIISQWYHLVIVEMCQLKDNLTPEIIAESLNLPLAEVKNAIKNLLRVEMIHKTEHGFKPVSDTSHFGDEAPSDAIKNFHSQILTLAQKMIFEKEAPLRISHSLVFSINGKDRDLLNKEIRTDLYKIVNKYAVKKQVNSVHVVSLQSFEVVDLEGRST
jgi:uncharacterized protein (TIGR02147 family)